MRKISLTCIMIAGRTSGIVGLIAGAAGLLQPGLVQAGTVVEVLSDNELTTILTDGKQARVNTAGAEYIIVDYQSHTVKMVDPVKKQVMLLAADASTAGLSAPKVQTSLKKLGSGGLVAGYKTEKYAYSVNGRHCGVIYGSLQAYREKGIQALFAAMDNLVKKQQAAMGGYVGMIDDCTLGEMQFSDQTGRLGVPMRTEKNGVVNSEVKSIKWNVELPTDAFLVPASYKTTTLEEQMREVRRQMQQYQPQMQQMMEQMQRSGQVDADTMTQMQMMQEMMRQQER